MKSQKSKKQSQKKKRSEDYSIILLDVCRGYSPFKVSEKQYFFKHFTVEEMLSFDNFELEELEKAKKDGIRTESSIINDAIEEGYWSVEKEEKIESLKWTINHSLKALSKMQDENQKKVFEKQIEKQRDESSLIEAQRQSLCLYSAEQLSQKKRYAKMVSSSCFKDEGLKERISPDKVEPASAGVFKRFSTLSDRDTLLRTSFNTHFFEVFLTQYRNPLALFGSNFLELTIFQKNIISLSNGLYAKMKNVRIPDSISGDPVKIMNYVEPKDKSGAKVTHGIEDLKAKMKSRGGELKPEDLLT